MQQLQQFYSPRLEFAQCSLTLTLCILQPGRYVATVGWGNSHHPHRITTPWIIEVHLQEILQILTKADKILSQT